MTVEDGFPLLLHLKLPALLGILHLIQHIGSTAGAGQHIVGVCKRLVILKVQEWRPSQMACSGYSTHTRKSNRPATETGAAGLYKQTVSGAKQSRHPCAKSKMNSTTEIGGSSSLSEEEVFVKCFHESSFPKTFPIRSKDQDKDSGHLCLRTAFPDK